MGRAEDTGGQQISKLMPMLLLSGFVGSGKTRLYILLPSFLMASVIAFSLAVNTHGRKKGLPRSTRRQRSGSGGGSGGSGAEGRHNPSGHNIPGGRAGGVATSAVSSASSGEGSDLARALANPDNFSLTAFDDSYALYQRLTGGAEGQPEADEGAVWDMKGMYQSALAVLGDAFRIYGPECVYGSYNGGKDAVVIMHLMRAALAEFSVKSGRIYRPRLIYFTNPREFPEVENLVKDTTASYDLDLVQYDTGFVGGLKDCVQNRHPGKVREALGFVLGTRRGDPNCGAQQTFTPSSDWMPPFMRVNPIIDWTYGQVWQFLCGNFLPYCSLYDDGYTSLGNVDNTIRNPALKRTRREGGGQEESYWPAYALTDWSLERAGRTDKKLEGDTMEIAGLERLECEFRSIDRRHGKLSEATTAGLVVIGYEILTGETADSNTGFAMNALREVGVSLKRVAIINDNFEEIRDEVRRQAQLFDLVITSGGVGPTHDDVTIKSIAEAFSQRMAINPDMLKVIASRIGVRSAEELEESQRKMAVLPEMARLRFPPPKRKANNEKASSSVSSSFSPLSSSAERGSGEKPQWPILQCENVFVLPGVPQFFEEKMGTICEHFLEGREVFSAKVALAVEESTFASKLNSIVNRFPTVAFGSYPYFNTNSNDGGGNGKGGGEGKGVFKEGEREFITIITVESVASAADVDGALAAVLEGVQDQYGEDDTVLRVTRRSNST